MEIRRVKELALLNQRFKESPVVAILGPRQCGKTTLARQFVREHRSRKIHFFDLEDSRDVARLKNPLLTLEGLRGYVVIDEIQRRPGLFPALRVLVDKYPQTRYLILGSASQDLIRQGSESLAGRITFLELGGFSLDLIPFKDLKKLWHRGGFPRSFLARTAEASFQWRQDFISTFLERDIPALGIPIPAPTLRRFWMMLAHYHGQIFNASELGRSLSTGDNTVARYLDILSGTFMVRRLQPWFYNTKKRLVKRPKVYFRDSGLLHALLSIASEKDLVSHPKLGASWEGFALEQIIQHLNLREEEVWFWSTHTGAELDLLFEKRGKRWGIEIKYADAPTLTQSMKSALEELSLAHLWVVYPGNQDYRLDTRVSVIPIQNLSLISY